MGSLFFTPKLSINNIVVAERDICDWNSKHFAAYSFARPRVALNLSCFNHRNQISDDACNRNMQVVWLSPDDGSLWFKCKKTYSKNGLLNL